MRMSTMMKLKRKDIVDNAGVRPKAVWDIKTVELYIRLCLDEVKKGEHNGTNLTEKGWKSVLSNINEKLTGKDYGKNQLKNKWYNLKRDWQEWYKLFANETLVGGDSAERWEKKQLENPQYGKFRRKGLRCYNELTTLFKGMVAIRQVALAPSFGMLPNGIDDSNDEYRLSVESGGIDLEEGYGDTEELEGICAGVGAVFRDISFSSSYGNDSEMSSVKRKRSESCERIEKKKNMKISDAERIADALCRIASACQLREAVRKALIVPGTSIAEVVAELQHIEVIGSDLDWHSRCCQLMLFKPAREMFVALKGLGNEQSLLNWLKYAAYTPLPFMKEVD
ncbi:L10-interacting MYB domain-containing protein-like [Trifolium pratense]|uniref:L10-interacting MYB domain-containing protein-like n=1 Tax=Trifolium pratense TaxID=57577 RepID=UPI001E691AD2|nr:L10-interacting MYB domain-containing protein-like [Trifolium pratense]